MSDNAVTVERGTVSTCATCGRTCGRSAFNGNDMHIERVARRWHFVKSAHMAVPVGKSQEAPA